jgi:alpha-glucosidase
MGALIFRVGELVCALNVDADPVALPEGELLLASGPLADGRLPPDTAAWLALRRT